MNQSIVNQRVLDVYKTSHRGIDARQFFHTEDGAKESRSRAAVFLGCFDTHQAQFETLFDKVRIELSVLIHLRHTWAQLALSKFAHTRAKHLLVFGKRS